MFEAIHSSLVPGEYSKREKFLEQQRRLREIRDRHIQLLHESGFLQRLLLSDDRNTEDCRATNFRLLQEKEYTPLDALRRMPLSASTKFELTFDTTVVQQRLIVLRFDQGRQTGHFVLGSRITDEGSLVGNPAFGMEVSDCEFAFALADDLDRIRREEKLRNLTRELVDKFNVYDPLNEQEFQDVH